MTSYFVFRNDQYQVIPGCLFNIDTETNSYPIKTWTTGSNRIGFWNYPFSECLICWLKCRGLIHRGLKICYKSEWTELCFARIETATACDFSFVLMPVHGMSPLNNPWRDTGWCSQGPGLTSRTQMWCCNKHMEHYRAEATVDQFICLVTVLTLTTWTFD